MQLPSLVLLLECNILCCTRVVCEQETCVSAGSAAEQHIHPLLVEDKLAQQLSYLDWMTQLHKTVLAKT